MKKKRKIGGIWYTLDAYINADSSVTVVIISKYSNLPVFKKKYVRSAEGAMAQAWHDWGKVRAQIGLLKMRLGIKAVAMHGFYLLNL